MALCQPWKDQRMLTLKGDKYNKEDPLLFDEATGKEANLEESRKYLELKVKETGFSGKYIKGNFLQIGEAYFYENYSP